MHNINIFRDPGGGITETQVASSSSTKQVHIEFKTAEQCFINKVRTVKIYYELN